MMFKITFSYMKIGQWFKTKLKIIVLFCFCRDKKSHIAVKDVLMPMILYVLFNKIV